MPKKNCAEITRDGKCEPAFYPGGRGDYPFSARGDNSDVDVIISCGECERRRVPPRTRRRTGCNRHVHTYTRTKKKLRTNSKRIVLKRGLINRGGGTAFSLSRVAADTRLRYRRAPVTPEKPPQLIPGSSRWRHRALLAAPARSSANAARPDPKPPHTSSGWVARTPASAERSARMLSRQW